MMLNGHLFSSMPTQETSSRPDREQPKRVEGVVERSPHFALALIATVSSKRDPFNPRKTHVNFQSTANPLTPTIKWNQTPTVRRKPDCTI
jgi:hypothetical protein